MNDLRWMWIIPEDIKDQWENDSWWWEISWATFPSFYPSPEIFSVAANTHWVMPLRALRKPYTRRARAISALGLPWPFLGRWTTSTQYWCICIYYTYVYHTYTYAYAYTYTYTIIYTLICKYLYVCIYLHMYVYMYTRIHIYMYLYIYIYVYCIRMFL